MYNEMKILQKYKEYAEEQGLIVYAIALKVLRITTSQTEIVM